MKWNVSSEGLDEDLLILIGHIEDRLPVGLELVVTSAYRPDDLLSHGQGLAVDIAAEDSWTRFQIVKVLLGLGVCRIGVYDRHVHFDISVSLPQHVLWIGESK